MSYNFADGEVLLIDKPLKWTSFDVVRKIRNLIKIKKVGHAGTLDPLATGLLVVCTGKKTKTIESIQATEKEYTGTITLGKTTESYDLEQEFNGEYPIDHISEKSIIDTTELFLGDINQIPPIHSAIKVDGQRVYKKARKGELVELKPRPVTIYEFEILAVEMPNVQFRIKCSKGTYIRSIAHDFGQALNSGAHLSALRRTKVGNFDVSSALSIDDFIKSVQKNV